MDYTDDVIIYYDTFYDTLESVFTQEEYDASLLKQGWWLYHREYMNGYKVWFLKSIFGNEKIVGKTNILERLGMEHTHTNAHSSFPYYIPLMKYKVAKCKKFNLCGCDSSFMQPFIYVNKRGCGMLNEYVMHYFLHNASFKLKFGEGDDILKYALTEEHPDFKMYDDILQFTISRKAYLDSLPCDNDIEYSE